MEPLEIGGTMKRSQFKLVAVLLLAFGLLFSSCWSIVGLRVRPSLSVGPDSPTYLQVDMVPWDTALNVANGHVFVLVGYQWDGMQSSAAVFDPQNIWGAKEKVTHFGNAQYVGQLVNGGECVLSAGGIGSGTVTAGDFVGDFEAWRVWITSDPVDQTNDAKVDDILRFRHVIKDPENTVGSGQIIVFIGFTNDYDAWNCTGMAVTKVRFQD
jgi:hypothetical protein